VDGLDVGAQALLHGVRLHGLARERGEGVVGERVDQRLQQPKLAAEVVVDGGDVDVRGPGHRLERQTAHALLEQDLVGGRQHRLRRQG